MGRKDKKSSARSPPPAAAASSDHDTTLPNISPSSTKHISATTTSKPTVPQPSRSTIQPNSPGHPNPKPFKPEPKSKPATVAALPSPSSKRQSEKNNSESKQSEKKARKEKEKHSSGDASSSGGGAQKMLNQRVWSGEDEVMILKGLIEYKVKNGVKPMSNADDFFEFIQGSVHVTDVKKEQLVRKVRGLKDKFLNSLKKSKPPTNPLELEAFNLSKTIWGGEETVVKGNGNGSALKPVKEKGGHALKHVRQSERVEVGDKKDEEEGVFKSSKCENLGEGLIEAESVFSVASGALVKRAMEKMEGTNMEELRKKVKKANVASLQCYFRRLDVLEFAVNKMLDDVGSD